MDITESSRILWGISAENPKESQEPNSADVDSTLPVPTAATTAFHENKLSPASQATSTSDHSTQAARPKKVRVFDVEAGESSRTPL